MNNDMSSYFEDPEFKDILAKYEGMVKHHTPTYFDAEELTDIAEYYASLGEEQKAEDAINFALRLHPTNTDALVFKSRSLCIKGQLNEAYQVMNLIEDSSDREVKFLKADLLIEEHRLDEADMIYEELAIAEEESFEILLDIFMSYMDTNQKEYAAKWLHKIEKKGYTEINSQKYRDALCDFCMTFGYPQRATKVFQLSLDELPYSVPHWNGLAKCYLAQNEITKAHEAVDFALAIEENNQEALEIKSFCYLQSENQEEALCLLRQLLPITKAPNRIYGLMVKCYLDMEKSTEAKAICQEWLKECPKLTSFERSEIFSYISMCCFNLHQPEEAMNYVDAALDLEPSFRGAILQKGMIYLEMQENEKAEELFQKVLDISPDDEQSEVLYNVANCYFFLQMYSETIDWCSRICKNYPEEQLEALHLIACSYFCMLDIDSCLKYLAKIWQMCDQKFEEEYINDKRFRQMFSNIANIYRNNRHKE